MVAKVISGKDIQGALNYNEQKVLEGKAVLLQASGFLKGTTELNFYDKLNRFTNLHERNHRTKTNTLHISLNFDPSEKLEPETLNQIALAYMEKIGFGDQPYLVYEHKDAAHPHMHIVTSIIQEDGKRKPIHYLGKNESEKARKEIEQEFGLVKASSKKKHQTVEIRPIDVQQAAYGKSETHRSISNIVRFVTRSYKYTSLPELNAALRQFNVTADRGTEKSNMFARKGLIYSLIDSQGKRIGIPMKASAIYGKPTLPFLEKQFGLNEVLRQPIKHSLRKRIDEVLQSGSVSSREQFIDALERNGTRVLFRTNAEGRTYGITFIDNNQKTVFNGSTLGKQYSANAILETLSAKPETIQSSANEERIVRDSINTQNEDHSSHSASAGLLKDLVTADGFDPTSPEAALRLGRNKKKRKKRRL
jgi:hypothetical protein